MNALADADEHTLRISIDTKATVHVGDYLLSTVDAVINRAGNFCWKGMRTMACLVDAIYEKGGKPCSNEKRDLEHRLKRSAELNWWDITIHPKSVLL